MTELQVKKLVGKRVKFRLPAFKHAIQIDTYEGVVNVQEYKLVNSTKIHYNILLTECLKNGLKCTHDIVIMWNRLNEIKKLEVLESD